MRSLYCDINPSTGCRVLLELEWSLILTPSREVMKRER